MILFRGCDDSFIVSNFVLWILFWKSQLIGFWITGSINWIVKTNIPNIMGSRGQSLNKYIEVTDGIFLEVKTFSNKSKIPSTL